jgi:hypothetical protein
MKENQVLLFSRLSRSLLAETVAEAESSEQSYTERLRKSFESRHPGEVSYVQMDLNTLIISGVSLELLGERCKLSEQKLFGPKYLGRFGHLKNIEDLSSTVSSKAKGQVKVTYSTSIDASLCLLVVYFDPIGYS